MRAHKGLFHKYDIQSLTSILNMSEESFQNIFRTSPPPIDETGIWSLTVTYQGTDGEDHSLNISGNSLFAKLAHEIRSIGLKVADGENIEDLINHDLKSELEEAGMLFKPGLTVSGAARIVLEVLDGTCQIHRCQAIKPRSDEVCGNYFIKDMLVGKVREYCSNTCKNRILARRRRNNKIKPL